MCNMNTSTKNIFRNTKIERNVKVTLLVNQYRPLLIQILIIKNFLKVLKNLI